jgi:hypothetical protein
MYENQLYEASVHTTVTTRMNHVPARAREPVFENQLYEEAMVPVHGVETVVRANDMMARRRSQTVAIGSGSVSSSSNDLFVANIPTRSLAR